MDLYLPNGPGNHPVVMFIHGGGFSQGDKGGHAKKGRAFADADRNTRRSPGPLTVSTSAESTGIAVEPAGGSSARDAIVTESAKLGVTPFLPPLVPFGSKQWPTLITPGTGPASIADLSQ